MLLLEVRTSAHHREIWTLLPQKSVQPVFETRAGVRLSAVIRRRNVGSARHYMRLLLLHATMNWSRKHI
jgi:hypothetical protein